MDRRGGGVGVEHGEEAASAGGGDVYSLAEAARLKGVSYHTVSRAVRQGKLPHHRIGRMAFVSAAALAEWRPMVERAPKKHRRRRPDPAAVPALLDLASGDRTRLARHVAALVETLRAATDRPPADVLVLLCEHLADVLDLDRAAIVAVDGSPLAEFARPGRRGDPAGAAPGSSLELPLTFGDRRLGTLVGEAGGPPASRAADQAAMARAMAALAALVLAAERPGAAG